MQIADGTYIGESNRNITIDRNMTIIGQSKTGTIIDAEKQDRVFIITNGISLTIQNLTIRNGNATDGGAIYHSGGNLTVIGSTFVNNTASVTPTSDSSYAARGGAIYHSGGNLTVIGSTFVNNTASVPNSNFDTSSNSYGGAIYNYGTLTVIASTFTNNTAFGVGGQTNYYTSGGAIYNFGNLTVTGSTFEDNTANHYGGAVYHVGGNSTVTNSTFTENSSSKGGAICNGSGTLTVTGSNFTGNTGGGGAIYNEGRMMTVIGSNFTGNTVAIYNAGKMTVTNSTFTENTANYNGGAIFNEGGTLTVTGSNFTGNNVTATSTEYGYGGGAIYNYGGTCTVNFNRFYNNTAIRGSAIYCYFNSVNAEYNWWGSNNPDFTSLIFATKYGSVDVDPWLVMNINVDPLTIRAGQTATIIVNVYTDSDGVDHSADAEKFFSGPRVIFTTDLGSIGSKSITVNWDHGVAFAVLRADEGLGLATITATDGQTLTTTVNITPDGILGEDTANTVKATGETIPLQKTGTPINYLLLAVLLVVSGFLVPKINN